MIKSPRIMALAFALLTVVAPAVAAETLSLDVTVPVVAMPSELFKPNGQAADFLGTGLTQTVDDIRKFLTDQHFSNENPSTVYLLDEQYFGVEIVASGPNRYLTSSVWSGPEDADTSQGVQVEFSSPLSGQLSTTVKRFVTYKARRGPLLETLRSAILQKYGPPSFDHKNEMLWFWRAGQLVKSDAHDKRMVITMDTDSNYIKAVSYTLADDAARQANWDRISRYQKSVEDGAKQVRDAHATAPKL